LKDGVEAAAVERVKMAKSQMAITVQVVAVVEHS